MNRLEGLDIRAEDMVQNPEEPGEIEKFYNGMNVFITGGTGFVGKVLIEKLLRTCSGINRIYLLMRAKKGKEPQNRFEEIFGDVVFNKLRVAQPNFQEKLVMVCGMLDKPRLAMTDEDYDRLVKDVNVVFHCAATVRFDEKIGMATAINVKGTKEMLDLAKLMKNLRAFVHVSTAYANCPRKDIDEKVYETPITADKLMSIVDTLDEQQLEAITPLLIGNWPNTYVYTKAIAENLIKTYGEGLPIAMVRPSIVIATAKEPVAGWIDNLYGATGIAVGAAVGLLRTLHCDPENVADLVPVDYVVNSMIAASWKMGISKGDNKNKEIEHVNTTEEKEKIPIYNYIGSTQAPISWREYMRLTELYAFQIPSPVVVWHYCFRLNKNWYIHMLAVYLLHFLPALIVDGACIVLGKKPRLVKGYKKINKFSSVLSYFSSRQWKFHNENVQSLWKSLSPIDKEKFEFNMGDLSWDEYFYSYVRGMRVYLLKDPLETIPQGRIKLMKLKIAHYFLLALLLLGVFKLFLTIFYSIFG